MAIFVVENTNDDGAGSLRQAITNANASAGAGADTITFASRFDGEADDIIRLTSGEISITDALTIRGGPSRVTITGDANGDDVTAEGAITDVEASLAGATDLLADNSRIFNATGAS